MRNIDLFSRHLPPKQNQKVYSIFNRFFYGLRHASRLLGIHQTSIQYQIDKGKCYFVRVNGRPLIPSWYIPYALRKDVDSIVCWKIIDTIRTINGNEHDVGYVLFEATDGEIFLRDVLRHRRKVEVQIASYPTKNLVTQNLILFKKPTLKAPGKIVKEYLVRPPYVVSFFIELDDDLMAKEVLVDQDLKQCRLEVHAYSEVGSKCPNYIGMLTWEEYNLFRKAFLYNDKNAFDCLSVKDDGIFLPLNPII